MFTLTYHGVTMAAAAAIAAATLPYGAAAADPNQDDQFLAVLQEKQIPAMENISTVVAAGHTVCRKLDDGIPARTVLDGLNNDAYGMNPDLREQSDRLSATMSRFIAAAVEVYCPGDQNKIASLAAGRTWRTTGLARVFVVANHRPRTDLPGAVLGSPVDTIATGDASQPKPPKIPPPPAPKAKIPRSPGAVTKPPPRQQPPPPQQLPPPAPQAPPEQLPPPPPEQPPPPPQDLPAPGGPQSGSATDGSGPGNGGSGSGGAGGGGADNGAPAEPPPAPPRPPGMIQLVPW
ncbi:MULTISPECIES: DUF732 domain-containing protein [Mycolicibacter]|uniref:DUF732 domain-containing protein n=1 Tax=Mycolicibacter TaxID=1073531 RepID=UPI0007EACE35|nr:MULTISPECIES: DUF732 domain-containing protein [Mycolicibacter]OBG33605.1 hypothetical protein A5671_06120 [Mycolicibacter heraklionensis]ULP45758.1 DUF732 domain-containing protein [Mycolicibacter virginiensis]